MQSRNAVKLILMFCVVFCIILLFAGCGISEKNHEKDTEEKNPVTQLETENKETETETETESYNDPSTPVTDYVPVDPASTSVFDNSLFIGDSRTMGLSRYGDLGEADVFATSGMNVFRIFKETVNVNGTDRTLEEMLTSKHYDKIFIMLGINEIGYEKSVVIRKYSETIETLTQKCDGAEIIIMANLHIVEKRSSCDNVYNNTNLNELNAGMQALSNGNNIIYVDVNPIFDDQNGALSEGYAFDDFHLLGGYYMQWSMWLAKAVEEL